MLTATELYMVTTGLDSQTNSGKIASLLMVEGPQAMEVFSTFEFAARDDKNKKL